MRLLPPGFCPFCRGRQAILRVKRDDGLTIEKLICSRCMDVAKMMRSPAKRETPDDVPPPAR